MEFTPDLIALQGVLISSDNVYQFSQLSAKGGNEDKIKFVIESVRCFLQNANIDVLNTTNDDIPILRKFALYLILNSDFPILEEIVEFDGIDFIIWTVPTIPKCLLCELLWNLNLDPFVKEIISFCAPELALQVAQAALTNVKYSTPSESLSKLQIICEALYLNICRLNFFNLNSEKILCILKDMFSCFQKCAKYFSEPPNPGKLEILHKDDKYKHSGKALCTLINVIYNCLQLYTGNIEAKLSNSYHMYTLTYNRDHIAKDIVNCQIQTADKSILEHLDKCNAALLEICELLVMEVSVDIYCAWSEFEENGQSLQQTVGELCFKLREKLLTVEKVSNEPIVAMLKQIARKPEEIKDVVNNADRETIIKKCTINGEDKIQWIHALVSRNNVVEDISLMELLICNLEVIDEKRKEKIFLNLYNSLKTEIENKERLKTWLIKVFEKCSPSTKQKLLNEHYCNNKLTDELESQELSDYMTETFNKLIVSPQAVLTDVLCLFLQNPKKVYNKIFDVAIENAHQRNIMLQLIELLDDFKTHYYSSDMEPCIVKVTIDKLDAVLDTDAKTNNLLQFVCSLKSSNVIPTSKLLLLIIMPKLHKGLIDKNIRLINSQCRLLQDGFTIEELLEYRAPMLAMYAQIMNVVRWRIDTYDDLKPKTLQQVINLQMSLINTYEDSLPENEAVWLKSKLKNLDPLNMYYYKKIWNPPGTNYVEVITGKTVNEKNNLQELTAWVSQVLCSTSEQEWYHIWDSLVQIDSEVALSMIHDALCLITLAQGSNHCDTSWKCLLNCYTNFVYILRFKYLKSPLTDEQVITVMNKIKTAENILTEDKVEEFGAILIPLFVYLIERKQEYNLDIYNYLETKIKHQKFLSVVNKVLQNGSGKV